MDFSGYTDDDLLEMIGRHLSENMDVAASRKTSRGSYILIARQWLEKSERKLRVNICSNPKVKEFALAPDTPHEALIRALGDAIAGVVAYVPLATIAEYIRRQGLPAYCGELWNSEVSTKN